MDPRTSAQDVMRCDLCETAIVQIHCDTCLVNLCKACVGKHISTDESVDHKVVKFQSRKSTPLYPGCDSHEKEQCEMYCRHCDIPVCHSCLASDQHLGHKLSKILHILDEKKDITKKEQTELKEKIYPTYQNIAADVQKRICQLEEEYGDLSSAITKHGDIWHREIDKLVNKLKKQVDEMKTSQLQTLQKHLDDINKKIVGIKDEIDSLEDVVDSNDSSSLFSVRSSVDQYEKLPQKLVTSVPKFTPGTIQGEVLCHLFGALSSISLKSEELGYSMRTRQESKEDEFSFKVQQNSSDTGSHFPIKKLIDRPVISHINIFRNIFRFITLENVACLSNEKIWTCGNGSTMSLCNIKQFFPLKSIRTKSGNIPTDIAVTRNDNLIYTDHKARTVNMVKNEEIEVVIRLQNWKPQGTCSTSSGDLLVTMESDDNKQTKVVRYSDSTEKQSIQFDDKGRPLYSSDGSLRYICENRNFDICVSDIAAKAVVVVNQAGKLRFRYTGHIYTAPASKQFSPRGMTTDSQSHILTADFDNRCVHIIDQDGQFLQYIECTFIPCGLCTDAEDNLYLAVRDSKSWFSLSHLKEIKYLQ